MCGLSVSSCDVVPSRKINVIILKIIRAYRFSIYILNIYKREFVCIIAERLFKSFGLKYLFLAQAHLVLR